MLSGLGVKKATDIGSDRQPGPTDLDADDEGPWAIDFDAGPEAPVNEEVVVRWIKEVMDDPTVSISS